VGVRVKQTCAAQESQEIQEEITRDSYLMLFEPPSLLEKVQGNSRRGKPNDYEIRSKYQKVVAGVGLQQNGDLRV